MDVHNRDAVAGIIGVMQIIRYVFWLIVLFLWTPLAFKFVLDLVTLAVRG